MIFDVNKIDLNKNSVVICSPDKAFKYNYMCTVFKKVGLNYPEYRWNFRKHNTQPGESHIGIIEWAKKLSLPYVIIYEDDAYPCNEPIKKFNILKNDIEKNDIDFTILSIGKNGYTGNARDISEEFIEVLDMFHGSHAYIITSDAYDEIIDVYKYNSQINPMYRGVLYDTLFAKKYLKHHINAKWSLFYQKDWINDVIYLPTVKDPRTFNDIKRMLDEDDKHPVVQYFKNNYTFELLQDNEEFENIRNLKEFLNFSQDI